MIRGSDGLDYENLTEKLLSNPAKTRRNGALQELRHQGIPKDEQKLWTDTYDAEFERLRPHVSLLAADWEARGQANYALSVHRIAESDRRHAAKRYDLPTTQDRRSPG